MRQRSVLFNTFLLILTLMGCQEPVTTKPPKAKESTAAIRAAASAAPSAIASAPGSSAASAAPSAPACPSTSVVKIGLEPSIDSAFFLSGVSFDEMDGGPTVQGTFEREACIDLQFVREDYEPLLKSFVKGEVDGVLTRSTNLFLLAAERKKQGQGETTVLFATSWDKTSAPTVPFDTFEGNKNVKYPTKDLGKYEISTLLVMGRNMANTTQGVDAAKVLAKSFKTMTTRLYDPSTRPAALIALADVLEVDTKTIENSLEGVEILSPDTNVFATPEWDTAAKRLEAFAVQCKAISKGEVISFYEPTKDPETKKTETVTTPSAPASGTISAPAPVPQAKDEATLVFNPNILF